MAVLTDPDDLNQGTEIDISTGPRTFTLNVAGNLTNDGVTGQCVYSFFKEEWKTDAALIPHPFPMVLIDADAGKAEFGTDGANYNGWKPANNTTRKLIRNLGWREFSNVGVLDQEHAGILTLGSMEDEANDQPYYAVGDDPTDTGAKINFTYAGPVNEAVLVYEENVPADAGTGVSFIDGGGGNDQITRNDAGNFITDGYVVGGQITILNATVSANNGTYPILAVTASTIDVPTASLTADTGDNTATMSRNYRNAITLFLRVRDADPNGKTFAQATLADTADSELKNKVTAFPLSNDTDLKISETDANISSQSPYTEIVIRYFDQAYARDGLSGGAQNFGIVIDVGTHSLVDGSAPGAASVLTSAEGGIDTTPGVYDGGTLYCHEGTDAGTSWPIVSVTATTVTVTGTIANVSNGSFHLQRATPVSATAEEIYEKVQYLLRQAADIDSTDQTVAGDIADELLAFSGEDLRCGQGIPTNPNGGGSGVMIEGFSANDTNRLYFWDNTGTSRNYPFVAAGTIESNANLVNDPGPAEYWMFFEYTERTNVADLVVNAGGTITSAGSNLPVVSSGDYFRVSGLTGGDAAMNGIYLASGTPTAASIDCTRYDGAAMVTTSSAAADFDENPIDSPDAIIVNDNSGTPISGIDITQASQTWDFDYDGNVQGGRTAGTDAAVVVRALGLDTAQFVSATRTIARETGQTITLVANLERNYQNL